MDNVRDQATRLLFAQKYIKKKDITLIHDHLDNDGIRIKHNVCVLGMIGSIVLGSISAYYNKDVAIAMFILSEIAAVCYYLDATIQNQDSLRYVMPGIAIPGIALNMLIIPIGGLLTIPHILSVFILGSIGGMFVMFISCLWNLEL